MFKGLKNFTKLRESEGMSCGFLLSLFLSTRLILTIIGVISRKLLDPIWGKHYVWHYSRHLWLDIWGLWDTGYYLDIAKHGYSTALGTHPTTLNQANYGFFLCTLF